MKRSCFLIVVLAVLIAVPPSLASASELKPFVRGSWKGLVEAQSGAPFIAHFWGLTCAPCRAEMPAWGRLLAATPGLNLVTVNADLVPNEPGDAMEFLERSGLAEAQNFIFDGNFVERLRYEIDPSWQGEIPVTLLIGADGSRKKIEGAADMDEVRAWLDAQVLETGSRPAHR